MRDSVKHRNKMTAEKELSYKNAFVHEFISKQIAQTMIFISQYNLPLKIEGTFDTDHPEAKVLYGFIGWI